MTDLILMQGAARYIRCERLADAETELCGYGRRPLLLHGQRALEAVRDELPAILARNGVQPVDWLNDGFCSRRQLRRAAEDARRAQCDFVLAVGGGKCMDLGKAVAAELRMPVVTLPTVAATAVSATADR